MTGFNMHNKRPQAAVFGGRLLLMALAALLLLGLTSSTKRVPRFEEMYECYIITDVEVSDYQADDFEQVDYEEFMSAIARARRAYIGFVPAKEVNLYDDDGVRYRMYISASYRFFRIDSNYFKLSCSQARRLKNLIG